MIIYKIQNRQTNEVYIGQTARDFNLRMQEHRRKSEYGVSTKLYDAIREFGWENFSKEILDDTAQTLEELDALEKYYIILYDSVKSGYNMTFGGDDNPMRDMQIRKKHDEKMRSEEVRKKISTTMKGKQKTPEHIQKVKDALRAFYASGKRPNYSSPQHLTPEHKQKLLESKFKPVVCVSQEDGTEHTFQSKKDASIFLNGLYDVKLYKKNVTGINHSISCGNAYLGYVWQEYSRV